MRLINSGFALILFFSLTPILNADVTIRYKTGVKFNSLPPAVAQQVSGSQKSAFPPIIVIQIKGDKGYSNAGLTASLLDFTKQQITLMDATEKLFATVYVKDFLGAAMPTMPLLPAAQKILESMKSNFSAQKTGRTDVILGIQIEETELTFSLELPMPADLSSPLAFKLGENVTLVKTVTQIWTATPREVLRLPVLTELAAHMSFSGRLMFPAAAMQQALANMPGFSQGLAAMEEFSNHSTPMLRSHSDTYMPLVARFAQLQKAQGEAALAGFDADGPSIETNVEVMDISDASLDDSVFQVPVDYHATTLPDLLNVLMPSVRAPEAPAKNLHATP